jgi:hypothetical protein
MTSFALEILRRGVIQIDTDPPVASLMTGGVSRNRAKLRDPMSLRTGCSACGIEPADPAVSRSESAICVVYPRMRILTCYGM